jgi:hypothetical protein
MASPNLVIVRAGENSYHKTWGTSSNWDLLVSYYGNDPEKYQGDGFERVDGPGGKLGDTFNLWYTRPDLFKNRKYVWLVDDDVEITSANIDNLFATMEEYKLQLAQPALILEGYVNHRITAVHDGFKLRYTTMVETMIPCWSIELLKKVMPLFENTRYGWGLDHIWHQYATPKSTAILDCVPSKHCRPQGTGELYVHDLDPIVEMRKNLAKFSLTQVPTPTNIGGVLKNNSYVEGNALKQALEAPSSKVLDSMIETVQRNPNHTRVMDRHVGLRGVRPVQVRSKT